MHAAKGILTARGGMTSHAAVVARGWAALRLRRRRAEDRSATGAMTAAQYNSAGRDHHHRWRQRPGIQGRRAHAQPELTGDFGTLMRWADSIRALRVRTNADTPADAATARRFGAEGIGLCRTEHMFFDADRIIAVRQMILADDEQQRRAALDKLLPMQRGDFAEIFRAMDGLPVTIRLLDPPLHEFLPQNEDEIAEVARRPPAPPELRARAIALHETNPMLGHRGCRLGITYPEIYEMQARAIFEAALAVEASGTAPVQSNHDPASGLQERTRFPEGADSGVAAAIGGNMGAVRST